MHMAGGGDAQEGEGGCTCILCIPPGYAPVHRYLCFRENQRLRYLDVTVVDKVIDPNTLCHALSLSNVYDTCVSGRTKD